MQNTSLERVSVERFYRLVFMDDLKFYGNSEKEAEKLSSFKAERYFQRILLWSLLHASVHISQLKPEHLLVLVEWRINTKA